MPAPCTQGAGETTEQPENTAMIVELSQDRMGGVTAEPVGAKWRERRDSSVYFQGGTDELAGEIPHRKLRELADGWTVRVRVDAWVFGHWLGYDAHTVAE